MYVYANTERYNISLNSNWSLLIQQMMINTETNNCLTCRGQETMEHLSLNRTTLLKLLYPKTLGSLQNKGQKDCRSQRWWMTTRQLNFPDSWSAPHTNSQQL